MEIIKSNVGKFSERSAKKKIIGGKQISGLLQSRVTSYNNIL